MIAATTVCGRISPVPIGSNLDRQLLEKMRSETDATLLGAGTLRSDDPEMKGPDGDCLDNRIRAIVSHSGKVPKDRKLFHEGPQPVVLTSLAEERRLSEELGNCAQVIGLPPGPQGLLIDAALSELSRMGAGSVLIEGGGKLNYSCLRDRVVDEIVLTVCPVISGDIKSKHLVEGEKPLGQPFLPLDLISCDSAETGELFIRYRIKRG